MPVRNLLILTGAVPGYRFLSWNHSERPEALGYAVFRSEDRYSSWKRLEADPIPGNRYRDESKLEEVAYTLKDSDWVDRGVTGFYTFKVPESPLYARIQDGRALLASQPADVGVWIDDVFVNPARVDGLTGMIWLPRAFGLVRDGGRKEFMLPEAAEGSTVKVVYRRLANFVNPTPENRCYYTVVPVVPGGGLEHEPGAPGTEVVNTLEVDRADYMFQAMSEWNAWIFNFTGEPAHLLFKRSRGKRCGCVVEGQARTGCTVCYETGIVGGYYGPYDFMFIDPDSGVSKELNEGGVKTTRTSRSYLGPAPLVQAGDLIIRKNGERMVIGPVTPKSPRGVLLQQEFDVELLTPGDTRYRVPFRPALDPTTYNPAFEEAGPNAEPVSSPLTDPTKVWENLKPPAGRTVTFGNIET